jgi:hypothetical protein
MPLPKLKFGDRVRNGWAGDANPLREGIFVRKSRDGGEWCIEVTDGKGKFWTLMLPDSDHRLEVLAP